MLPKRQVAVITFILVGGISAVWGQSWKVPPSPRERARDRIQMVRMLKLTEALKLDRETAARFFAVSSRYEETKRQVRQDLHDDIEHLRHLMQNLNPPEKDLKETVSRIKNRKKDLGDLSNKQIEEELSLLRTEQQARYLLFTIDFHREIQDILREVREERPPARAGERWPYPPPRNPSETYRESNKERRR